MNIYNKINKFPYTSISYKSIQRLTEQRSEKGSIHHDDITTTTAAWWLTLARTALVFYRHSSEDDESNWCDTLQGLFKSLQGVPMSPGGHITLLSVSFQQLSVNTMSPTHPCVDCSFDTIWSTGVVSPHILTPILPSSSLTPSSLACSLDT